MYARRTRLGSVVRAGGWPSAERDDRTPTGPNPGAESADAAIRSLYDTHGAALLGYLMRLTKGDRYRAEDMLQETLIRAWRHPEARDGTGQWNRAWLYMVARRIAIDHVRAVLARPPEVGDERLQERPDPEVDVERVSRAELWAAVLDLPDRFRDVLVEVYFRDRSVAQAAEVLGVPEGTIKSRTFYALRALRELYAKRGLLPPRSD
jgi:RNA polymerase sigma-70 factor (ECF subfamily)